MVGADNSPVKIEPDILDASASALGALFVLLDQEGQIVRFSATCEQLTGHSFEEVQGRTVWDLFLSPDDVEAAKAHFAEVQTDHAPRKSESTWNTKHGRRRIAWSHVAVVYDGASAQRVAGLGTDITECHAAQQKALQACEEWKERAAEHPSALVAAEDALQSEIDRRQRAEELLWALVKPRPDIVNGAKHAVFVLDTKWRIIWCNQTMLQLCGGGAPEAVIGQPCYRVVHGLSQPTQGCVMARLLKSQSREATRISLQGAVYTVIVDPLLDDTGRLAGAVHAMVDITELVPLSTSRPQVPTKSAPPTALPSRRKTSVVSTRGQGGDDPIQEYPPSRDSRATDVRLVGISAATRQVRRQIREAIEARCDTVLITGETGTGKEVTAQTIQSQAGPPEAPFVAVSCAALPETLVESELFGHMKGAFTGADSNRVGQFELAHGGTIFLDEIGDLSTTAQAKILRVLENRTLRRVGGDLEIPVDLRVIAATNVRLDQRVESGEFRQDLYYRLLVYPIHLLPLRERRDDILPLAKHFLSEFASSRGLRIEGFSDDATARLYGYDFPGNARELRYMVQRAAIMCHSDRIRATHLRSAFPSRVTAQDDPGRDREVAKILEALERTHWNRGRAAKHLGISYSTLRRRMLKLGISR